MDIIMANRKDACQRIKTTRDSNGNSRAIWFQYAINNDNVEVFNLFIEGPEGKPSFCPTSRLLPEIKVTPSEFNRLKKEYKHWL